MTTTATAKPRQTRFRFGSPTPPPRYSDDDLREQIAVGSMADRIDREQRIIRGVKILGLTSGNGRTYTEQCLRDAAPLYEGARVYDAHFESSEDQPERHPHDRPLGEWLGVLRGVRYERDGLYADFHYLESNAVSSILLEACERFPDRLGMSPHHVGRRDLQTSQVNQIIKVYSVDLVRSPATVSGMFESDNHQRGKRPMKKKFRDIVAGAPAGTAGLEVLQEMLADQVLAEMDVEMDTAAGMPAAGDQLAAAFAAAVAAVMSSDEPIDAKKAKLLALLKAQEQVAAPAETKPDPAAEAEGDDAEPMADEAEKESQSKEADPALRTRLAKLEAELESRKARDEVRALFESQKVSPTASQIEAAAALTGDTRKQFIADTVEMLRESADDGATLPRSGPRNPIGGNASAVGGYPRFDKGEFARACR